jgi:hypothetical protein
MTAGRFLSQQFFGKYGGRLHLFASLKPVFSETTKLCQQISVIDIFVSK